METPEIISLYPKGTRPYFTDRRAGGIVMRQVSLRCNCDCLISRQSYYDSKPGKIKARAAVIEIWNNDVARFIQPTGCDPENPK